MPTAANFLPGSWRRALRRSFLYLARNFFDLLWGGEHLNAPDTFVDRVPIYMRNILNTSEFLMISRPAPGSASNEYGFHIINYDLETGFEWNGDFYDAGLPATAHLKQVLAGPNAHLAFVRVERPDNPTESGVRVYRTSWCETPPVQFVRLLHSEESIVGMGNDPAYTTLVSKDGVIYVYGPMCVNADVQLIRSSDEPQSYGITARCANPLSSGTILVDEEVEESDEPDTPWAVDVVQPGEPSDSGVHLFTLAGPGSSTYHHYGVPTAPAEYGLGQRHVTLEWYVGQSTGSGGVSFGLWARLVITGDNKGVRMYYFPGTGWEYRLVPFKSESSGYNYWYYEFPKPVRDWDIRLPGESFNGELHMVAAQNDGRLCLSTFSVNLDPLGVQTYFKVRHSEQEPNGDVRCVFWATDSRIMLVKPRIEVHSDGRVRLAATTDMPEF